FGEPNDQLAFAARFVEHGRTVADLLGGERPPDFLARVLVEGHDGPAFAADEAIEEIAIDQRMGSPPPNRRAIELVFFDEALGPAHLAGPALETAQITHGTEGVNPIL